MIKNRIEKNLKRLKSWVEQNKIEAYRIYDRDIPEFPFIVDKYLDYLVIYDKSQEWIDKEKNHRPLLEQALVEIFKVSPEKIIIKARQKQKGLNQYEKIQESGRFISVREHQAQLRVNLWDYLDTGLFLDHRPMRQWMFKNSKDLKVLNLFCYTGAVSVFAALGGGQVTSVDMSKTYLDWARENFSLNQLSENDHEFIQSDVLQWIDELRPNNYDLIFLDPPTFSNSKKMADSFEVERDQLSLIRITMQALTPGGKLIFSNNKRDFKLDPEVASFAHVKNITRQSLPPDFHDPKIHHCFELSPQK